MKVNVFEEYEGVPQAWEITEGGRPIGYVFDCGAANCVTLNFVGKTFPVQFLGGAVEYNGDGSDLTQTTYVSANGGHVAIESVWEDLDIGFESGAEASVRTCD